MPKLSFFISLYVDFCTCVITCFFKSENYIFFFICASVCNTFLKKNICLQSSDIQPLVVNITNGPACAWIFFVSLRPAIGVCRRCLHYQNANLIPKAEITKLLIDYIVENYPIDKNMKKIDLQEFINFCIKNSKHILKLNNVLEIEKNDEIEVI